MTIWEHKEICAIKSIKPIRTFRKNNKDCRELEWFYFKYIPYGEGNASTGLSTYCRDPNVKNWHQVSEITKCGSTTIFHKINGNSCISDKTYNFPFSLTNPFLAILNKFNKVKNFEKYVRGYFRSCMAISLVGN